MRNEERLDHLITMIQAYENLTGTKIQKELFSDPFQFVRSQFPFLASAANVLLDIRQQMDKSKLGINLPALKRICKCDQAKYNEGLGKLFYQDEMWHIVTGYSIISLFNDIESLPHINLDKCKPFDVTNFINACMEEETQLITPSIQAVKEYIAKCKAIDPKGNFAYKLENGTCINPHYLLDFLQALPDSRLYNSGERKAIYFKGSNIGYGVVLPVLVSSARIIE